VGLVAVERLTRVVLVGVVLAERQRLDYGQGSGDRADPGLAEHRQFVPPRSIISWIDTG